MEVRRRANQLNHPTTWLSFKETESEEELEEDVLCEPYYSSYPTSPKYPDMLPPDYPAILSLLFSIIGICWANKFSVWLSLAFICGSFAGIKFNEIDYTQIFVSCCFCVMSLVRVIVFPDYPDD